MEEAVEFEMAEDEAGFAADSDVAGNATGESFDQQGGVPQERLIIRTADLSITVDDTPETIDDIAGLASGMGGFVVSSNTYQSFEESYGGNITVRVPAERFDEALDAIKDMAVEVNNETISGQDVTEEFVDLEARVNNLKAAEAQLQEIMENAQDTEDVLAVYNQLTQTRGEIEVLEGRMNYLRDSARLSTINVNLEPNIITQPVDVRWRPGETLKLALERLGRTMADVVDFLINFVIVVLPTLIVLGLVFGIIIAPVYFVGRGMWRRARRRRSERKQQAEQKDSE